ncbi:4Fe-4S binding protein [uncultured Adlercreutzia sp.]|uniref:4Fe-4S binding protein n=1 Tax=uncultured Adlercreutzia sp. TaxID=875803 RepID=UPI0026F37E90|nr:4Fe-4S binding protein [uncultured Adlercreutzia sp.]
MKSNKLRVAVPLAVGAVAAAGFMLNTGFGNLSAIGWKDISILCPLGALTTMLASKTLVPQALISLGIAVVLILVLGRLFCGWICPVPVVNKLPRLFKKKESAPASDGALQTAESPKKAAKACASCADGCADCREHAKTKFDSRHVILAGSLLSATIFGFPVFCLVCPIGLSFATLFLVIALFAGGDITWSVLVVPLLLLVEVVLFKKWCGRICPLSAFMSLIGKVNSRTLRPTVDLERCIERPGSSATCGRCATVCEVGIDPRHPERGVGFSECLKCRACVEVCPTKAITMPLVPKRAANVEIVPEEADETAAIAG